MYNLCEFEETVHTVKLHSKSIRTSLKHTKMWDNQLSLTENITSILCLYPSVHQDLPFTNRHSVCNFSTPATYSYTIRILHCKVSNKYPFLSYVVFNVALLSFSLVCTADSDSPSSPNLKRGIRMVR